LKWMRLAMTSREAAAAPTKAAVWRAAPREAAEKFGSLTAGDLF
jgi:hypothetical protein